MPVRRFRDGRDIPAPWREAGDPGLFRAIERVLATAETACGYRYPRGVYKFRSIEEMKAQKERWSLENFRQLQERRKNRA
jgi:hypothetical protein